MYLQTGGIFSGDHVYRIHPISADLRNKMSLKGHGHHVITRRSLRHLANPVGYFPEPVKGNCA